MAASGDGSVGPQPGGARVDRYWDDPIVVRLWGEHDLTTVDSVTSALVGAGAVADRDVLVDLADVTFMDASTLGPLVRSRQVLAARGSGLSVRSPQSTQRRVLEICGLAALIEAAPPSGTPPGQGALTALETWIEVPSAGRPAEITPAARPATPKGDAEETRR